MAIVCDMRHSFFSSISSVGVGGLVQELLDMAWESRLFKKNVGEDDGAKTIGSARLVTFAWSICVILVGFFSPGYGTSCVWVWLQDFCKGDMVGTHVDDVYNLIVDHNASTDGDTFILPCQIMQLSSVMVSGYCAPSSSTF